MTLVAYAPLATGQTAYEGFLQTGSGGVDSTNDSGTTIDAGDNTVSLGTLHGITLLNDPTPAPSTKATTHSEKQTMAQPRKLAHRPTRVCQNWQRESH